MKKEIANGRKIITFFATDFVNEFVSLEEVDFEDMKESARKIGKEFVRDGKTNVKLEFVKKEMKTILSFDQI